MTVPFPKMSLPQDGSSCEEHTAADPGYSYVKLEGPKGHVHVALLQSN